MDKRSSHFFFLVRVWLPPPQSRAMFRAWREVNAKKLAQGKGTTLLFHQRRRESDMQRKLAPFFFESQLKKGVEAHLGMPPLSPFSVNFNFYSLFP
jgi:hypothetical protein